MPHFVLGGDETGLMASAGDVKIVVHMPTSAKLDLSFNAEEDELKCEFEVVREEVAKMSVFDLPPPIFPARLVILTFQMLGPEK